MNPHAEVTHKKTAYPIFECGVLRFSPKQKYQKLRNKTTSKNAPRELHTNFTANIQKILSLLF